MMQNPAFLAESAGLLPLTERLCYLECRSRSPRTLRGIPEVESDPSNDQNF